MQEIVDALGNQLLGDPENPGVHYNLSVAYDMLGHADSLGQFQEAVPFLERCLSLEPEHVGAKAELQKAYRGLGH